MKLVTKFIEKVGVDKALHFLTGALINALLIPFGLEYTVLGIMVAFIISCIKELLDSFEKGNSCDWKDVIVGVIGACIMCGYYYLVW